MPDAVYKNTTGKKWFWLYYIDRGIACHGIEQVPAGVLRVSL